MKHIRKFPANRFNGESVPMTVKVTAELNYIPGNSAPYFSLTMDAHQTGHPNQCKSGGAAHDTILQYFPQFADIAAMHLSNMDGAPMHAEANGWYWLSGAMGGFGEDYHGGNSKGGHGGKYRETTPSECLQIFADHCRITMREARGIAAAVALNGAPRTKWAQIMEIMRPRWESEAKACITNHSLEVTGDKRAA